MSMLIKAGAQVNQKAADGMTPLMQAARREPGAPEIIYALLKAGADVRPKSREGKTAFDYASVNRSLDGTEVARMLRPPR